MHEGVSKRKVAVSYQYFLINILIFVTIRKGGKYTHSLESTKINVVKFPETLLCFLFFLQLYDFLNVIVIMCIYQKVFSIIVICA